MEPNPTLDQLHVFLTVVEKGSFSAASRALNRAQSVVSYTITGLEAQLGVALFERVGTKRPELTEAGQSVLEDARRMVADLDLMRARIRGLKDGLEGYLSVAISVMVPSEVISRVLSTFQSRYPTVSLGVTVGELGVVVEAVANGTAIVGFGGAVVRKDNLVIAERIGESFMIPVAAADHRLGKLKGQLTLSDVRDETQLVVSDVSGLTKGRDFNVLSIKTWRVSEFTTKHLFIRAGLGWGGLPVPMVQDDVRDGTLVHLDLPAYNHREYPIYAVTKIANPPGPAGRWLIGEFQEELARFCSHFDTQLPNDARSH
jgi:DNA-binding transcriptional LysR family regulator